MGGETDDGLLAVLGKPDRSSTSMSNVLTRRSAAVGASTATSSSSS
nr:hypothetical protein [Halolamina pelagica]